MPDLKRFGRWETVTVVLLVASILYGAVSAGGFISGQNLNSILSDVAEIALISLPMTLIIIAAEIDLSVASMLGLTSALLGYLWNHNWPMEAVIPVLLVVGGLLGAVNGVLVTRLGLPSLAVTIGTLGLYRGLAFVVLGDQAVTEFPSNYLNYGQGSFAGTQIPNPTILFIVLAVIFGVTLHRTAVGRSIFAIGANDEAARFAGLRVKRVKFWLFVVSGVVAAIAGFVYTFRFGSARGDNGTGLELSVVACVLLGGVSIFGGRGHLLGVIVAVLPARHAAQRAHAQQRVLGRAHRRHRRPAAPLRARAERHGPRARGARSQPPHHHPPPIHIPVRRDMSISKFALVPVLALAVAACGSTKSSTEKARARGNASSTKSAPKNSSGKLTIAFLPKQVNNPYFTVVRQRRQAGRHVAGGHVQAGRPVGCDGVLAGAPTSTR